MNHQEKVRRFNALTHNPPTLFKLLERVIGWIVILLLMSFALVFTKDEVRITVSPRIFTCIPQVKYQAMVLVRLEPHSDNRLLTLVWASDTGTSGKAFYELNGERSFRSLTRYIEINCATYYFEACVHRLTNGKSVSFCDHQYLEPVGADDGTR